MPKEIVPVDKIPLASDVKDVQIVDSKSMIGLYSLFIQLSDVCLKNKGIGLSAVQVGEPLRFFVVEFKNKYKGFANCTYEKVGPQIDSIEGCLSLKDSSGKLTRYKVPRSSEIRVRGLELDSDSPSPNLVEFDRTYKDIWAIVFAHEIDHQNGILISELGELVEIW